MVFDSVVAVVIDALVLVNVVIISGHLQYVVIVINIIVVLLLSRRFLSKATTELEPVTAVPLRPCLSKGGASRKPAPYAQLPYPSPMPPYLVPQTKLVFSSSARSCSECLPTCSPPPPIPGSTFSSGLPRSRCQRHGQSPLTNGCGTGCKGPFGVLGARREPRCFWLRRLRW